MIEGLMQDHPLTLRHILERARRIYGTTEVVTETGGEPQRATYADVAARVDRLAGALRALGVGEGDRVATFAWNTQEHLELYFAVPCSGAVLHTLNIRLFPDDLAYIVDHAQDKVLFVDASLADKAAPLVERLPSIEHVVVIGDDDGTLPGALRYEELLAAAPERFDYPDLDDRAAAGLCYTSGTTGHPKGVLYSHRSQTLHSLGVLAADGLGLSSRDRVLPVVPMFHANAWGLPYAAAMTGAALLLPSRFTSAEALAGVIERERATVAAAVPTVWLDVLRLADERDPNLTSLHTVVCGGSAVPLALMRDLEERHRVRVIQAWGMTETGPLGSVARPPAGAGPEDAWRFRATAGRLVPFVEARVVADDGTVLPWDGESTGELEVRGPWVARAYYRDAAEEKFDGGWLRTGDVAAIDRDGYIHIADRAKDVIKSGGEWISSVELENELVDHPDVLEAAVIAKPDERWAERPLACVVLRPGAEPDPAGLRAHLEARVARWWLPDEFAFIDEVPKTGTGKFDKKLLRRRLADGALGTRMPAGEAKAAGTS